MTTTTTTQTTIHTDLTITRETMKNGKTRTTVTTPARERGGRTTRSVKAVTIGFGRTCEMQKHNAEPGWLVLSLNGSVAAAEKRLGWWADRGYSRAYVVTLDA